MLHSLLDKVPSQTPVRNMISDILSKDNATKKYRKDDEILQIDCCKLLWAHAQEQRVPVDSVLGSD